MIYLFRYDFWCVQLVLMPRALGGGASRTPPSLLCYVAPLSRCLVHSVSSLPLHLLCEPVVAHESLGQTERSNKRTSSPSRDSGRMYMYVQSQHSQFAVLHDDSIRHEYSDYSLAYMPHLNWHTTSVELSRLYTARCSIKEITFVRKLRRAATKPALTMRSGQK